MTMDSRSSPDVKFEDAQDMGPGIILELAAMSSVDDGFAPFETSRFSLAPGCRTGEDKHAAREMWIIGAGHGVLTYDNVDTDVKAGDFLFFRSHAPHSIRNTGSEELHIYSIWWSR